MKYTKREFEKLLKDKLMSECNVTLDMASADQIYRCLAMITRQIMSDRQKQFQSKVLGEGKKQVYYLCMEFLMGRSLRTSLFNLGLNEVAESVLADADVKIDTIYEQEPDAGLGNGGLGRLAACYLDGMATDCIPGTGYSILYEYGIFKQKIVDGWQTELPDAWLPGGDIWLVPRPEHTVNVNFGGTIEEFWDYGYHHVLHKDYSVVKAVPYDLMISGFDSKGISVLRVWSAKSPGFDMESFNRGDYIKAFGQDSTAEAISMMRYVQVALWRHPINGRASAKPSGVVFVVLDDVSVAVLRVIMSLSIALRSRLASAVVSWVPNVWFRPLAEGDDLSAPCVGMLK